MKILHILNDGPTDLAERIMRFESREHEVRVADLSKEEIDYDGLIDEIFSADRVVSW